MRGGRHQGVSECAVLEIGVGCEQERIVGEQSQAFAGIRKFTVEVRFRKSGQGGPKFITPDSRSAWPKAHANTMLSRTPTATETEGEPSDAL